MPLIVDFQIFETPPPRAFIEQILTHVSETALPETYPGLHRGPVARDEPFYILSTISVPRGKRPAGDMAPCPMCQPNKFLEGKLVYLPRLRAVAIIGHCCAAQETRHAAEREFIEREAKRRAEDYLLETLLRLPSYRLEVSNLRPAVGAAQVIFNQFRQKGAAFQTALRKASKGGTALTVTEIHGPRQAGGPSGIRTSGSTVETRDVTFGKLAGLSVIAAKCTLAADLMQAEQELSSFPVIASEDDVLFFLADLDKDALISTANRLRDLTMKIKLVKSGVIDFRTFFTPANAERITKWGTHRDSPLSMRASFPPSRIENTTLFELLGSNGRRLGILIPPEFW